MSGLPLCNPSSISSFWLTRRRGYSPKSLLYIPVCELCAWRQIRNLKYFNVSHVIIEWTSHIRRNKTTQVPKRKLCIWFKLIFPHLFPDLTMVADLPLSYVTTVWIETGEWAVLVCMSICSEKYLKTRWHGITRHGGGLGRVCVLINFSVQWDVVAE